MIQSAQCHAANKEEDFPGNELKRDHTRRQFEYSRIVRDNPYQSDDPALITKKFWSHV